MLGHLGMGTLKKSNKQSIINIEEKQYQTIEKQTINENCEILLNNNSVYNNSNNSNNNRSSSVINNNNKMASTTAIAPVNNNNKEENKKNKDLIPSPKVSQRRSSHDARKISNVNEDDLAKLRKPIKLKNIASEFESYDVFHNRVLDVSILLYIYMLYT